MPKKAKITLRLVCAHTIEMESRPNPRKDWPDPQMCPVHKKKFRVGEIHTVGTPAGYKSNKLEPMPKKRTRKKTTARKKK
jgi:hypothetical protein